MSKILRIIFAVVFLVGAFYFFLNVRYSNKSFILVYHHIDDYRGGLKSLYVSPRVFDKQMRYLYNKGYKSISLTDMCKMISQRKIMKKKFVITFDDGYKDNLKNAYPVLKKYGFIATVYIPIESIGRMVSYPEMPKSEHLSIEDLKLIKDVFDIGSHSLTHSNMSKMSIEIIKEELFKSRDYLGKNLSCDIQNFCYPFGKHFENYENLLSSSGYISACSTKVGLIDKDSDLYLLPRIEWKEIKTMNLKDFLKNLDFYVKIIFGL